jgi:SAM-dependent methyltransferase
MDLFNAGVQIELPRAGVHPERGHFVVNDLFDFSAVPYRFDLAISSSFLRRLTLNAAARMFASVIRTLAPGGRFFVTWSDNPDPKNFNPVDRPDGNPTSNDREPYHYNFDVLRVVAESVGARVERLDDSSHPRGDSVMVLTPARPA